MKKTSVCLLLFITLSFFLCGIQASLYFLPFSLPYFWFVILTYYSFKKSLQFSLVCNLFHIFIISQFSSIGISSLLVNMNLVSLLFLILRDRFHIGLLQMSLSSGVGCLFFLFNSWFLSSMANGFYWPNLWSWVGSSLMTVLVAPAIIPILSFFDQKIHIERIDTLENLRI